MTNYAELETENFFVQRDVHYRNDWKHQIRNFDQKNGVIRRFV